ncbi:MAG: hypothetical protein ACOYY2_12910 [Actinomycetota bacterium]
MAAVIWVCPVTCKPRKDAGHREACPRCCGWRAPGWREVPAPAPPTQGQSDLIEEMRRDVTRMR